MKHGARVKSLLLALLPSITAPLAQAENGWVRWLSADLRETEHEALQKRSALAAMGEPMTGNTVPEFGIQHRMLEAPPPESPWVQVDLGVSRDFDTVALVPALVDF